MIVDLEFSKLYNSVWMNQFKRIIYLFGEFEII